MIKTKIGKWAIGLGAVSVILMALSVILAAVVGGDAATVAAFISANRLFAVLTLAANLLLNLTGLLSLIFGVIALTESKDWAVAKFLGIFYGINFLLFILAEFIFPH